MKQTMKLLLSMLVLMLCLDTAAALADGESETPVCTHPGISYQETKAATCTEDGSEEGTCPKCNVTVTALIKAGHTACGDTCTRCKEYIAHSPSEDGSVCTTCGAGISSSCEHDWKEMVTVDPTCTKDGAGQKVCASCGNTQSVTIKATGHSYVDGKCTVCGADDPNAGGGECAHLRECDSVYCSLCGEYVYDQDVAIKHVHTYTTYDDNNHFTKCLGGNCGDYIADVVPHNIVYTKHTTEYQHMANCADCDWISNNWEFHTGATSCASSTGTCNMCGMTDVPLNDVPDHDTVVEEPKVPCLEYGKRITTCKNCDYRQEVTLSPVGHKWGAAQMIISSTCTQAGTSVQECDNCDATREDYLPLADHNYVDGMCTVCKKLDSSTCSHWRYCVGNTKYCQACNITLEVDITDVRHDEYYTYDETQHTVSCGYCDYTGASGAHTREYRVAPDNERCHMYVCTVCEYGLGLNNYHTCSADSDTCADCGYTGEKLHDYRDRGDATNYYKECAYCYKQIDIKPHTGLKYDIVGDNNEYHMLICEDCGYISGLWDLHSYSTGSNICSKCGYVGEGSDDGGNEGEGGSGEGGSDGDCQHWRYCNTAVRYCQGCSAEVNYDITDVRHHTDWFFDDDAHRYGCAALDCDYTEVAQEGHHIEYVTTEWDHYARCTECPWDWSNFGEHQCTPGSNVCTVCKYEGASVHDYETEYDLVNHRSMCTKCGDKVEAEHTIVLAFDTDHHWYECSFPTCGYWEGWLDHTTSCGGEEGYCNVCKQSGVVTVPGHDFELKIDGEYHYEKCTSCGEEGNSGVHWAYCTGDTSKCVECGASGVSFIQHNIDWEKPISNATHHWYDCNSCGEQAEYMEHYNTCDFRDSCTACGYKGTFELRHPYVNCTEAFDEKTHWGYCNVCKLYVYNEPHEPNKNGECWCGATGLNASCAHSFDWKTITASTCTQTGLMQQVCSKCGANGEQRVTPAQGHNWSTTSTDATCTTPGQERVSCTRCGDVQSSTSTPALGHNWSTTSTDATCTTPGQERISCTRCGDVQSNASTPALGHDYITTTQDATCTENGLTTTVCSRCGDVQSSKVLPMTGHNRMFRVTNAATCTAKGTRVWYCDNCRLVMEQEEIPAKGHSLVTTETDTATVVKCSRCDYEKVTPKATATPAPTAAPTATPAPTEAPTAEPTLEPTAEPTLEPTIAPAELPKDVVVKPVEDVVIEVELPVEEETDAPETEGDAEEPKPEVKQVKITVSEVAMEETPVVLPLPVEIEPTKVITIQMDIPEVTENEKVAIPEKVKVALPMTEVEIAELANTKLVLVLEDGTMVEIPYEVVDGKVVFTTERMGVFAFVPVEE